MAALHHATFHNHAACIETLVRMKADVNMLSQKYGNRCACLLMAGIDDELSDCFLIAYFTRSKTAFCQIE